MTEITFALRVAELNIRVVCQHQSTVHHCRDYRIDEDAPVLETIHITAEDIEGERLRLLSKKNPGEALEASTPEALERLQLCRRIAEILPKYDRVLFHGSSLSIDGRGILFTAKSGTGKSTHTRFWRQVFGDRVQMINDDKPFLHITQDSVTVYGTPWRGKHALGGNLSAPLEAVYFVNRGQENQVEAVSSRALYPLLLQQTYTPEDPAAMAKTLALVERLSRNTKLLKMYCNLDPQAARVALEGLEY